MLSRRAFGARRLSSHARWCACSVPMAGSQGACVGKVSSRLVDAASFARPHMKSCLLLSCPNALRAASRSSRRTSSALHVPRARHTGVGVDVFLVLSSTLPAIVMVRPRALLHSTTRWHWHGGGEVQTPSCSSVQRVVPSALRISARRVLHSLLRTMGILSYSPKFIRPRGVLEILRINISQRGLSRSRDWLSPCSVRCHHPR